MLNSRIKEIRTRLGLSQNKFGEKIGVSRDAIANIENNRVQPQDSLLKLICFSFHVNENWLRNGTGDIFIQDETFSLDEYAQKNKLSPLEFDIIKGYMELDIKTRECLMSHFKSIFDRHSEIAVAVEEDYIDKEVESYRRELELEKRVEGKSSALGGTKEA